MKRLLFLTLLAACAERIENVGNTLENPPQLTPEDHQIRWAVTFGTAGANQAGASAFAANGDVIAAVSLSGEHDFGDLNGPVLAPGVTGLLTRRAASDGHELWTKTFAPTGGFASVGAIAIDRDGAVIAVGMCSGTLQIGTTVIQTDPVIGFEAFVVKYDASGELLWVQHEATLPVGMGGLAVDGDGNVFVGGSIFVGVPDVDYDYDAKLWSYAADGTPRWSHVFGGDGYQAIDKLAVGPSGALAVAGTIDAPASFGGAVLTPSYANGVVAMFTNDGTHLWSSLIGPIDPSAIVMIEDVAIDSTGRVILESQDQINTELMSGEWPKTFIRAWEPGGTQLWTETMGTEHRFRALTILPDDTIGSTAWIDSDRIDYRHLDEVRGNWEMKRFASDGSLTTIEQAGARMVGSVIGNTRICHSATAASGETAVAGEFAGTIDLGSGPLMSADDKSSNAMVFVVEPNAVDAAAP